MRDVRRSRSTLVALLVCAAVPALFATWFQLGWGGAATVECVDYIGSGVVAAVACAVCWRTGRQSPSALRASWQLVSAGCVAWLLGEVAWCFDVYVAHRPPTKPSIVDVGFWLLPVAFAVSLLRLPVRVPGRQRLRWVLDSVIVAGCALLTAWVLFASWWPRSSAELGTLVYPFLDVALLTLTVITFLNVTVGRVRMLLAAVSVVTLCFADTTFAYATANGTYAAGSICDVAYVATFALLAAAGCLPPPAEDAAVRALRPPQWIGGLGPYIPVPIAAAVTLTVRARGHEIGLVGIVLWVAITSGVLLRQALVLRDNRRLLGEVRTQAEQLARYASTDSLTGLANRDAFRSRVEDALAARTSMRRLAVLWIDLDDFKVVNDTHGHAAGDVLLRAAAARLAGAVRRDDVVARLGGDEFAVLVSNGDNADDVARRLLDALAPPFPVCDRELTVQASVGVARVAPYDATPSVDDLLARADVAMYVAKAAGKNRVVTHRAGMTVPGAEDVALREPLARAVSERAVTLVYQPIVETVSRRLVGFEALARWEHSGRPVSPERFIGVAERYDLIGPLGEQLLDDAVRQLAEWSRRRGDTDLVVTVNLAPAQLLDPELPLKVARILTRHAVSGRQLVCEITEGALLADEPTAHRVADELRELGVQLALDDFGVGYSSLAHLHRFPLTVLKIDKSFIADIDANGDAAAFAAAVLRLGAELGLRTVAEGVEREGQLQVLTALGADCAQGYLLSRPLSAEDAGDWVKPSRPARVPEPRRPTEAGRPAARSPRAAAARAGSR